jgi:hypothetical protein
VKFIYFFYHRTVITTNYVIKFFIFITVSPQIQRLHASLDLNKQEKFCLTNGARKRGKKGEKGRKREKNYSDFMSVSKNVRRFVILCYE